MRICRRCPTRIEWCSSRIFNAGVRAVDVRDPYKPKEIGYYIPAVSDRDRQALRPGGRCEPDPCKVAIQTNNVDVDDRGYVYAVDRANTGMHILELHRAGARGRRPAVRM